MGLIKSNLPSDSQPWARDIEDRLTTAENSLATSEFNNDARDAQLQTNINAVSDALSQVKTSSASQTRKQEFSAYFLSDTFYSRPVILSFERPSWANFVTVTSTVCVDALSIYSGVSNAIVGTAGIFINGNISTYETYELHSPVPDVPLVRDNTKSISASSSATNLFVKETAVLLDSQQIKFEGDTLNVWGVFQATTPLSNEIPPNDYANWTAEQIAQWDVGVNTNASFTIQILTTVQWSAQ